MKTHSILVISLGMFLSVHAYAQSDYHRTPARTERDPSFLQRAKSKINLGTQIIRKMGSISFGSAGGVAVEKDWKGVYGIIQTGAGDTPTKERKAQAIYSTMQSTLGTFVKNVKGRYGLAPRTRLALMSYNLKGKFGLSGKVTLPAAEKGNRIVFERKGGKETVTLFGAKNEALVKGTKTASDQGRIEHRTIEVKGSESLHMRDTLGDNGPPLFINY